MRHKPGPRFYADRVFRQSERQLRGALGLFLSSGYSDMALGLQTVNLRAHFLSISARSRSFSAFARDSYHGFGISSEFVLHTGYDLVLHLLVQLYEVCAVPRYPHYKVAVGLRIGFCR